MSQEQIAKILEKRYPNWISYKEIYDAIKLSRASIFRALRKLKRRNEVEIMIRCCQEINGSWQTFYRVKKEVK